MQYSYGTRSANLRLQGIAIGTFNTNREWVGTLDDPRIYDHVVTQTDLDALVVPESATLALLGLGGLLAIRRRR